MTLNYEGAADRESTEIANILGNHFASMNSIDGSIAEFRSRNNTTIHSIAVSPIPREQKISLINATFGPDELSFAPPKAHGKSTSLDEVGYMMLKRLPIELHYLQIPRSDECTQNKSARF